MPNAFNVLIVDPDPQARERFAAYIRAHGLPYGIFEADSLSQAKKVFIEQRIAVVASENNLGDGEALDLLQTEDLVPVIVITDKGSEQIAVRLMKAGAMDYLVKDSEGKYLAHLAAAVGQTPEHMERQSLWRTLIHAFMCINDAVFVTDMHDSVIFVNAAFCNIYKYEKKEILGRHVSILFNGENLPATKKDIPVQGWRGEVFQIRRDGRKFPASLSRSVVLDENGREVAVVGVARDITNRRQAEEQVRASLKEKEVLLREIHHRVKNNLQVISSLLNLQTGYVQDSQVIDALRDSQNRVKSMALIHERLYQSKVLTKIDFREYLQSLVSHIKNSYRGSEIDVIIDSDDVYLDVDTAISCGLIVNELVSNCLRHAFPPGGSGEVSVSFKSKKGARLCLEVADNGRGFPESVSLDNPSSLGLLLVGMLSRQINGAVELSSENGARVCMSFPTL